ncbi:MAG: 2-oxoacid:acceptor oxidoreductase family protein [Candidatus Aenigmarchaeota archaeon]|nr:2-oxoacid:acceptor oxidoreductase family protein [Candidatus Aenigmarchaeota archaeon]
MPSFSVFGRQRRDVELFARIFGNAATFSGFSVHAFPAANRERNGAPSTAYVRLEKGMIATKEVPETPDFCIILDSSISGNLCGKPAVTIINTTKKTKDRAIDASAIDVRRAFPAMLGALLKAYGKVSLKNVKTAMEQEGEKEAYAAVEAGYKAMK